MNRDAFFNRKPKIQDVTLDDGDVVKIRKLMESEVETLRKSYQGEGNTLAAIRYVVARCVVDDDGKRVFEDADQKRLQDIDFDTLEHIAAEVMEFSGLNKNAKKDSRDSATTQGD